MEVIPISLGTTRSFLLVGRKGGLVLVDAGNPGDGKRIIHAVEEAGYRPDDISLIVITHGHRDHVGGLAELQERLSVKAIVHREDVKALTEGKEPAVVPARLIGSLIEPILPERDIPLPPDKPEVIEEEKVSLKSFGFEGEVIYIPGHTFGSMGVISEDGTAVVGDLVMGRFVIYGRAVLPVFAEDLSSVRESIRKVLSRDPEIIHTSHGGPFRPGDLEEIL